MAQIDMKEGDSGELSCESFSDYFDEDEFADKTKFRSSLFDSPQLFHPHINRKSMGMKRSLNVYERLYRVPKKHTKPASERADKKTLTGSHPGNRLYASSKVIDRKACRKADLPSEICLSFSPDINRDSALPTSRDSMTVEEWLISSSHPKAKTSRHIQDFTFKPKINQTKGKALRAKATHFNSISQKKPQDTASHTPRGSYKNFLKRVSSAICQHDIEVEKLRKNIYPDFDRQTGQPWFYPVTNSKKYSVAEKFEDKDGKDHYFSVSNELIFYK